MSMSLSRHCRPTHSWPPGRRVKGTVCHKGLRVTSTVDYLVSLWGSHHVDLSVSDCLCTLEMFMNPFLQSTVSPGVRAAPACHWLTSFSSSLAAFPYAIDSQI